MDTTLWWLLLGQGACPGGAGGLKGREPSVAGSAGLRGEEEGRPGRSRWEEGTGASSPSAAAEGRGARDLHPNILLFPGPPLSPTGITAAMELGLLSGHK